VVGNVLSGVRQTAWKQADGRLFIPRQYPHQALHHGLASIVIAATLLLMALPTLQLAFLLEMSGFKGRSTSDKRMVAGYVTTGVIEVLCMVGLVIAMQGLTAAGRTGEPRVLRRGGALLAAFTAVVWLLVGVAWHSTAWRFLRPD